MIRYYAPPFALLSAVGITAEALCATFFKDERSPTLGARPPLEDET
jgi:hypothetical protein